MSAIDKNETLGSGPIDPQFRQMMNHLAINLDKILNDDRGGADRETGFVLLVFPFTKPDGTKYDGRANYISNARRDDIVTLLREQLAYFSGMPDNIRSTDAKPDNSSRLQTWQEDH